MGLVGLVSGIMQIVQTREPPPYMIMLTILLLALLFTGAVLGGRKLWQWIATGKQKKALQDKYDHVRQLVLKGQWITASKLLTELIERDYDGLRTQKEAYKKLLQGKLTIPAPGQGSRPAPIVTTDSATQRSAYWYQPVLVIGLGKTGYEVLRRTKARFIEAYGPEIPPLVRFLCVDTALRAGSPVQAANGCWVDLDTSEVLRIGDLRIEGILANIDRHPGLESWLVPKTIPDPDLGIKAGKIRHSRKLGRLALFISLALGDANVLARLEECIVRLREARTAIDARKYGIRTQDAGMSVFVVSSASDNVGSGMAIDLAYLIHHSMDSQGIDTERYQINGMFVLPSADSSTEIDDKTPAKTFAFLQELDHVMQKHEFSIPYTTKLRVTDSQRAPYKHCYLIGRHVAHNEPGDLESMLAESIFLQTTSRAGQTIQEEREPEPGYSAVGAANLLFPAQHVIEACTYRLASQLVQPLAQQQTEQEQYTSEIITELALDTLSATNLSPEVLWLRIGGQDREVSDGGTDSWARFGERLDRAIDDLERDLEEHIRSKTKDLIRAEPCGLDLATRYLEQVTEYLTILFLVLRKGKEQSHSLEGPTVGQQIQLYDALMKVVERTIVNLTSPLIQAQERSVKMLAGIAEDIEEAYPDVQNRLKTQSQFVQYCAISTRRPGDSVKRFFSRCAPNEEDAGLLLRGEMFEQIGYPFEWADKSRDDVESAILEFCRQWFLELGTVPVEAAGDLDTKTLLGLKEQAEPWWEGKATEHGQDLVIFGVGDPNEDLYRKNLHLGWFSATGDIHRITCLYTVHGLKSYSLAEYEHYQTAYYELSYQERAYLHCFAQCLDYDQERLVFAFAHALGLIERDKNGQYWQPYHNGGTRLGSSLADALANFVAHDDALTRSTKHLAGRKSREIGAASTIKCLRDYVAAMKDSTEDKDTAYQLARRVQKHLEEFPTYPLRDIA